MMDWRACNDECEVEDVSSLGDELSLGNERMEDAGGVRNLLTRAHLPFPLDPVLLKRLFDCEVYKQSRNNSGTGDALSRLEAVSMVELLIERSYMKGGYEHMADCMEGLEKDLGITIPEEKGGLFDSINLGEVESRLSLKKLEKVQEVVPEGLWLYLESPEGSIFPKIVLDKCKYLGQHTFIARVKADFAVTVAGKFMELYTNDTFVAPYCCDLLEVYVRDHQEYLNLLYKTSRNTVLWDYPVRHFLHNQVRQLEWQRDMAIHSAIANGGTAVFLGEVILVDDGAGN